MHILVTGGAGYIGSVVVEQLLLSGHRVTVVDNLSTGKKSHVEPAAAFYELNVGDTTAMGQLLKTQNIDVLMHFAAFSLVGESVSEPDRYFQNNIKNALNLLHVLKGSSCRKIIFSSTAAVYGNPETKPIDEQHPTRPINQYGLSKFTHETALAWFGRASRFK